MGKSCKKLPFQVDRTRPVLLTDQLVEGLKRAIATGYYREGEAIPSVRALSKLADVSFLVAYEAIRRLCEERIVVSRPRLGTVVAPSSDKRWLGRVLLVYSGIYGAHYKDQLSGGIGDVMARSGYVFSKVAVQAGDDAFSRLDFELSFSPVDFIIQHDVSPAVARRLHESGVPILTLSSDFRSVSPTHVDVSGDNPEALSCVLSNCVLAGLKKVVVASLFIRGTKGTAKTDRGIDVEYWKLPIDEKYGPVEGVQRGAMDAVFRRFGRKGVRHLPDVIFFTDDFATAGALTAFAELGIRAPDDLFVVTLSNKGFGPVYPRTLARIEADGYAEGVQVGEYVASYLSTGSWPAPLSIHRKFLSGETFPRGSERR